MGSLHCLSVGCSDATVIRTDLATFLVDCHNIGDHANLLPANKNLRGVFITHQHHDHYSGLNYLWDNGYSIDCLIYSPYDRRYADSTVSLEEWNEFNNLKNQFQGKGTKLFSPYRQDSFDTAYWETYGVKFWTIGPAKSVATSE